MVKHNEVDWATELRLLRRPIALVVMSAGADDAMQSARPKPLQRLCGRPMISHVIDAAKPLGLDRVVLVLGAGSERVAKSLLDDDAHSVPVEVVTQLRPLGTADAVSVALTALPDGDLDDDADGDVLVLPGDHPLLPTSLLGSIVVQHRRSDAAVTLLTTVVDDPSRSLRVVRGKGDRIKRLVSDDEAKPEELDLTEVSTSVYCFKRSVLGAALRRVTPGRYGEVQSLGRVVEVLGDAGYGTSAVTHHHAIDIMGVDTRAELAVAEAELRRRINARLMERGVNMVDPDRTYVDASVDVGADATLYPGVILQGATTIGAGAEIGPGCRIIDSDIGPGAVLEQTVARRSVIGEGAVVGPFAVLEPGAVVANGVRTGPHFVG